MVIAFVMMLSVSGCAQKSPSEKLADDAKRAANQMNKDIKDMFK